MTWSCRSGAWFAVLGEHSLVALPPSEKARVAAIWALVDDGAGFDETLDALISSGLRDLPGFVLVCRDGDETRVVLRGEAHAHFTTADEVVRVDGEAATTWVERTLHGVQHLQVQVAEEVETEQLRVAAGLVRIASATWGEAADRGDRRRNLSRRPSPSRRSLLRRCRPPPSSWSRRRPRRWPRRPTTTA